MDTPNLVTWGDTLKGMGNNRRRKYRIFLWLQQGMQCHYCKCHMRLVSVANGREQPDDLATFEHLVDDWAREEGKDESLDKIVLACYRCNNDRNKIRQAHAFSYYKARFVDRNEYLRFSNRAKPGDYVKKFGPMPLEEHIQVRLQS